MGSGEGDIDFTGRLGLGGKGTGEIRYSGEMGESVRRETAHILQVGITS